MNHNQSSYIPLLTRLGIMSLLLLALALGAFAAGGKVHVLFVGGDWKSQLPNFKGNDPRHPIPLRGYFVRQEVEKAAPGEFDFTLWTSYEFLQYADADSLAPFDVIVAGDIMGEGVLPRVVTALTAFVERGGGFMYCDNHKAFRFNTKERSFDAVLPIETIPYRPYTNTAAQPYCNEKPLAVTIKTPGHPTVRGLDFTAAPPLAGAHYGTEKPTATVLATSPAGKPIWVAWEKGKGRALWTGGLFANDELSADFSRWPQFGTFYAQLLRWLGEHSTAQQLPVTPITAQAKLTVNPARRGPALTARHFGIDDSYGGSYDMTPEELEAYLALKPENAFAIIRPMPGLTKRYPDNLEPEMDLSNFDLKNYTFDREDAQLAVLDRVHAVPILSYYGNWLAAGSPDPKRYTKLFAAAFEHANGTPGAPDRQTKIGHFEFLYDMYHIGLNAETFPQYLDLFSYLSDTLRKRYPEVKFGCGALATEWDYVPAMIDRCGKKLDWVSRKPFGMTGEAVFDLQDRFSAYAKKHGRKNLPFLITEWDAWLYGEPEFDYIMQRWKPLADHADTCLTTMQSRWREYTEGGYAYGFVSHTDGEYGERPPGWANPGKGKLNTYRYNAFWIMRDCRGTQYKVDLQIPEFKRSPSQRSYAIATSDGQQFNVVLYYGYPYINPQTGQDYNSIKLHLRVPIPREIKGRTLVVSRADARNRSEETPVTLQGDLLEMDVELPSLSAISLTVR